ELATMRALAPAVAPAKLLESATLEGARALGFDADYGSIDPGKMARLLAVAIPPDVDDVEEFLVSGIRPEQLFWIQCCSGGSQSTCRSFASATRYLRCGLR